MAVGILLLAFVLPLAVGTAAAGGVLCSSTDGPSCAALIGAEQQPLHVAPRMVDLDPPVPKPDGSDILLQTEGLLHKIEFMGYLANSMKQVEQRQAQKERGISPESAASSEGEDDREDDSEESSESGFVFLMMDDDGELVDASPNSERRRELLGQLRDTDDEDTETTVRVIPGSSHGSLEQALKEALARAASRLSDSHRTSGSGIDGEEKRPPVAGSADLGDEEQLEDLD